MFTLQDVENLQVKVDLPESLIRSLRPEPRAIQFRWVTMATVAGLFVAAVIGFGSVKISFFPDSNTPLFFVDVWEPEGTDIRKTRDDTLQITDYLRGLEGVVQTSTVIGGPHQRFTLVYDSKEMTPAYAQIIVQTDSLERIGPGRDGKIEARFHGPDPEVLRELAEQAKAIMREDPEAKEIRDDWREPIKVVQPVFNEQVGRQLGITRESVAGALQFAFEGNQVGLYRDGIRLLPIFVRAPAEERGDISNIRDIQLWSPVLQRSVPVLQVVSSFDTTWENAVVRARNRQQTITAQSNPTVKLATPLFERLRPQIEAIELPPGYSLSWGGEYEDSQKAQAGLGFATVLILIMVPTLYAILFRIKASD